MTSNQPAPYREQAVESSAARGSAVTRTAVAQRGLTYAACVWCVLFAAPHTWWALGIPAGFPGGQASYDFFMGSAWRVVYNMIVIVLSAMGVLVALALLRPPEQVVRRWIPYTAAWIACGLLSLRGLAGMIVDGASDPVWWPTFLAGGILFGSVAWSARAPAVPK